MNDRDAFEADDLRVLLQRLCGDDVPAAPSRDEAADMLRARCAAGPMTAGDQLAAELLLQRVGVGDAAAWERVLTDTRHDDSSRSFALRVLSADASNQSRALRLVTDDDDMDRLADARMVAEMIAQLTLDVVPEELAMALAAVPAPQRADRWDHIERCRRRALMPAAVTWVHVLCDPELVALRQRCLDAIDGEGGAAAAFLLAQCLGQLDDAVLASSIAQRVARMEHVAAPRANAVAPRVHGWMITQPAGVQLAFVLQHPEDVWVYGEFRCAPDGEVDTEVFMVAPEAPEIEPPTLAQGATVRPATREALYAALHDACAAAQRAGVGLTYPPLLVLGLLEGITAR